MLGGSVCTPALLASASCPGLAHCWGQSSLLTSMPRTHWPTQGLSALSPALDPVALMGRLVAASLEGLAMQYATGLSQEQKASQGGR